MRQTPHQKEVALLREVILGIRILPPIQPDHLTQEFLQVEEIGIAQPEIDRLIVVLKQSSSAFFDFLENVASRFPAMARGTIVYDIRTALLKALADYVNRDAASIGPRDVEAIEAQLVTWFDRLSTPRRVFVPCIISPWRAPRFSIGPADFVFIDDIQRSDFYPREDDWLGRSHFDKMIGVMKKGRANWLARISVEGCERSKAEEIGNVSAALAVVAIQLTVSPSFGTRNMGTLDTHRGLTVRTTISEADGYYFAKRSNVEPGMPIGDGTLAVFLRNAKPAIKAVGRLVNSFATGNYQLPKLERAWCDAAYWLHEALAENTDTVAIVKLETALEVLTKAESTSGSQARVEAILLTFYSLKPNDPVTSDSVVTARQFAKQIVRDRSQILHGTYSTLHSNMEMSRSGAETFVIGVIRRAAEELELYANSLSPSDDISGFLAWVRAKQES
ncbi:hypothetical protein JK208_12305 [Gluconobacter sp. Dm-74]|uniref:hypothetical protein n=1 Tax=Gluconobacter TaxID=441 RepID=UPI0019216204|nr:MULTISPECIES: hypothetical protein [Gluconobacter]MBS1092386.1 hypothetical protein [Gluconobacter sp. Dm-74]QQX92593.1 hypothetical protein IGS75_13555 [Gluconobacter sphaericus]